MKGSYLLLLELPEDKPITIGKHGPITFPHGFYIYVGSALNGINQRIQRHLRTRKKKHWHIDYLLEHATVVEIFYKENKKREECTIAQCFHNSCTSIPGFGCSDCTCSSHLFYEPKERFYKIIEKLQMTKANP